ncbi:MAG: YadA-like family protein, partial [Methylococcales bacterium]
TGGNATGLTNINATNGNITNLLGTNANYTNLANRKSVAKGRSASRCVDINAPHGINTNLLGTNANYTNLATSNLSATGGNATGLTNINATNGNITNLLGTNANYTNLATSNLSATGGNATGLTNINATNGNITNLLGTNANYTNLATSNLSATGGNATGLTNVNATNGNFTNINVTGGFTAGNITALNNVSGINGNFTNVNATNVSATNGNFTNINVTGGFTAGNITALNNVSGVNGNFTNLNATNNITANNTISAPNGNFTNLTTNSITANNTFTNNLNATNNITANNTISAPNGNFTNLTTNIITANNTVTRDLTVTGNATFNGVTDVNGILNLTNATVIGALSDRIMGDSKAPLSSNGVTGTNTVVNGTGAVITYKQALTQTVVANTTIGNRLTGTQYQTKVAGNEFIDGNLYVNGDSAFVGTTSATSTVDASKNLASSKLINATTGVIGQIGITTNTPVTDVQTGLTSTEAVASVTLTNGYGHTHGIQVFEDRTQITGGTASNAFTLDNNAISLSGNINGALASNGVTGLTGTVGAGGVSVLTTAATVAAGTTIGDRLTGVQYLNEINGNTLVDGNLYVNGDTNFVGKNGATSTVVGDPGTSKLANANRGVTGQTGVVMKGTPVVDPVTGFAIPAYESVASTTLTNGVGQTNGLKVYEDRTELTGGTQQSAKLTMNDNGATFSNSNGAPAKVTGVADGTTKYDAVNFGQLQGTAAALSDDMNNIAQRAYSGISQASAMAAIPAPMAGHHYSVGMGSGFYAGQQAIAFGGKADVGEHIRLSAAMGTGFGSTSQMSANTGAAFSW